LNPFASLHRWFTIGAFLWFAGSTTLLVLAFVLHRIQLSTTFSVYLFLTVVCSVIAFVLYGVDKRRAIKGQRRISERTLHFFGLLGGWPGADLAMRLFHHKTLKIRFRLVFWLTVSVHLGIIAYGIWSREPVTAIRSLIGIKSVSS
jgi:uncharacterized membrane protein YsdA (DUF1294 family)